MATATEYGLIAVGVSVAVAVTVTALSHGIGKDPYLEFYKRVDAACARPTTSGDRREIAWVEEYGKYYYCPSR